MDRGACWATLHRVTKSWTGLKECSMHITFLLKCFRCLPAALEVKTRCLRDFPGGSVVKSPRFQMQEAQVLSLVKKLRSHVPLSMAEKLKKKKRPDAPIGPSRPRVCAPQPLRAPTPSLSLGSSTDQGTLESLRFPCSLIHSTNIS